MLELNLSQNTNSTLQANGYNPNGKYYAKVETKEQYTLEKLAEHMHEHNAAFSAGLIQGVLVDMVTCIKHLVLAGCTVKIPNLGIFKCSVEANGLTLAKGAKISAGKGSQRTDAELQSNIAAQQFAIGAVKVIMQATGETSKDEVSNKAKMTFTSKAKALIKSKTGADATDGEGTATSGDDDTSGSSNSGSQSGSQSQQNSVAAPVISGTSPFEESTQVSISGPDGATIYYSENGDDPDTNDTLYTQPFTIDETTTIKAIAIKDGVSSSVASKTLYKSSGGDDGSGGFEMGS
ncbi:MAG: hypothetical protein E7107_12045 [Prevotella sp.]|nr:hypothetical protein [Prevotella sp.]